MVLESLVWKGKSLNHTSTYNFTSETLREIQEILEIEAGKHFGMWAFALQAFSSLLITSNHACTRQPTHFFLIIVLSFKGPQRIIAIIIQLLQEMKGQLFCFLAIVGLVCVTSRPFTPNLGRAVALGPAEINQGLQSLQTTMTISFPDKGQKSRGLKKEDEADYKAVKKLGSSPPNCEHKCFGCLPCQAIQVPTTSSRVGVQYANYEPEGWKCKCGHTFYTP